jgi:predicted nucleic acid-binding protein
MPITTNHDLFVDTSGWACYFDADEPYHQAASALCQAIVQGGLKLITTNYVISEFFVLVRQRKRVLMADAIHMIETLRSRPYIEVICIDPDLDTATLALLKNRQDKAWSWVDASSFVVMQQRGLTHALPLDKHFVQAGFVRVPEQA